MTRIRKWWAVVILLHALFPLPGEAGEPVSRERQSRHPEAPTELDLLGQLVGHWSIQSEVLQQDGSWQDRTDRRESWTFYWILDGHGIQDDYRTTYLNQAGDDSVTVFGTNIRTYNPDAGQWEMAWIHQNAPTVATFTAKNVDGRLEMEGINSLGRDVRITFHAITEQSFEWVVRWSFDNGQSWTPVAKLHATRQG